MARTLSDHAPVRVDLEIPGGPAQAYMWRLLPGALRDELFREELRYDIIFTLNRMWARPWASGYVTEMDDSSGERVAGTSEVLRVFTTFFQDLYSAPFAVPVEVIRGYFSDISLLWFDRAHREYFDAPFTIEEVNAAIRSLPGDKAPGLDGLTSAFYKEFTDILAPYLLDVYDEALRNRVLPASLCAVLIVTILKPGKAAVSCDSYRPLLMINNDN
ncbi:hypothetical protein NDU88_003926 [Pleurodeles waltl]|uniref:Uncharacterized protein n=1 Tax=Pleurodeles waltl TaxID=8319 RepID=A0AAV7NKQ4_PLEWA|nr:hypothetical protein NDU88_003926 [Pleurodeles waltl]